MTSRPKAVIYSDCPVFGGADNLLIHLLGDGPLARDYDLAFIYRHNPSFGEGVRRKIRTAASVSSVRFPERLEWLDAMERKVGNALLRKTIKIFLRLVDYPLFLYEIIALWAAFSVHKPELVHINNGGYPGALGCRAAAVAARLTGARRVIFNVNNFAVPLRLPWEMIDFLIDRLVIAFCDIFVTASKAAGEALIRRGFPEERIFQVPNAARTPGGLRPAGDLRKELGLAPRHVALLVAAFFEPRKGHAVLLEAVRLLRERGVPGIDRLRILLAGNGPLRANIEKRARAMGVEKQVLFLEYRTDIPDVLNACDALVLPSVSSEDMPYAVLEAMALSKSVVSTRLAGIPEMVEDGATGLLAEPGDAEELSRALERLLKDDAGRAAMGRRGHERFLKDFEAMRACARYAELYTGLLAGNGALPERSRRPRVLLYSDCPVFGGADNLLVHLLGDSPLTRSYNLSFLYRYNAPFADGVRRKIRTQSRVDSLDFPERLEWIESMERRIKGRLPRKAIKIFLRLVDYPLYLYELFLLRGEFLRGRPRIVHINNGGYPGALGCRAAALAARLAGAERVIFNVNSTALKPRLPWELIDLIIDRAVIHSSDIFITASVAAGLALARRGFPADRIRQIPNAVRSPAGLRPPDEIRRELGLTPGHVVFAMIAFFESLKGHRVLLEALHRFESRRPGCLANLKILLIGEGSERDARRREAEKLGIGPSLSFLGYRTDALDILNACDGLILPSTSSEDMPYAILEAMALSKPVIASRLSGIPETVEAGITGLLVPPGDAEELSRAIQQLLEDEGLRREMGREGRARFLEQFEASRVGERYRELYGELLPASGLPQ